jgi:5-methylcytosine-specific restriction endonuclease McrA
MIEITEIPETENQECRSCLYIKPAHVRIIIKRDPRSQVANRFALCMSCLDALRESIIKIIPF